MRQNQQRRQKESPVRWEGNQDSVLSLKPRGKKKTFQGEGVDRAKYSRSNEIRTEHCMLHFL